MGTGIKMLKSLVLLSVCVTGMYGKYIMPGLGNSGQVRPLPPPPACDSCCPAPPPVDEDKIADSRRRRNVDIGTSNWTRKRVWMLVDFCMEREEFLCGGNNAVGPVRRRARKIVSGGVTTHQHAWPGLLGHPRHQTTAGRKQQQTAELLPLGQTGRGDLENVNVMLR